MSGASGAEYTPLTYLVKGRAQSDKQHPSVHGLSSSGALRPGSLRVPRGEYLVDQDSALKTFDFMNSKGCLVGHSHIPFICVESGDGAEFLDFDCGQPMPLVENRCIIIPGGVGQPRDRDPRPSYAIYDSDASAIERHRVTYDIKEAQDKMRRAGLPQPLIQRLEHGYRPISAKGRIGRRSIDNQT